jgi:hypothetical protein
MQRHILTVVAAGSLLMTAAIWLWWPGLESQLAFWGRLAAVSAAARLAYDDIQRLPGWLLLMLPVVVIVVVRWPKFFFLLLPALVIWAIVRKVLQPR